MKIAIGNDHAAGALKPVIMELLTEMGCEIVNCGPDGTEPIDYPIPAEKVGRMVADHEVDYGVLICGTGIGISMAANKVNGVRAAVCSEPTSARLTREHNNANILAIGARIVSDELAKDIVRTFLTTEYSNGERHERRLALLHEIEKRQ
ncbi:MAG: ribose 5-phosphate isomerase B [Lachnospiraceae bacterium]|nr:ribose 5-phosphate isomerase B [Lachnospiraceae bacterium]MDY3818314.1 ribose 5-phosphate isomerase B [Lachnospiraceae bacterium]